MGLTTAIALALNCKPSVIPVYARSLDCAKACLLMLFEGNLNQKNTREKSWISSFSIRFPHHHEWVDQELIEFRARQRRSAPHPIVYLYYNIGDFLQAAMKDGWRFQKANWQIPSWVIQRYPKLVLQYWLVFKARIFLFVNRKGNPCRTAAHVTSQAMSQKGLTQIYHLLTCLGFFCTWKKRYQPAKMGVINHQSFRSHPRTISIMKLFGRPAIRQLLSFLDPIPFESLNHQIGVFRQLERVQQGFV